MKYLCLVCFDGAIIDTLPPGEWDKLVKDSPKSWDFQYDLEVDQGQQAHSVRYHLDAAPPPLKALTDKLNDEVEPD